MYLLEVKRSLLEKKIKSKGKVMVSMVLQALVLGPGDDKTHKQMGLDKFLYMLIEVTTRLT